MKCLKENYYDIAISDFDGTLFSSKNGISENVLNVIRRFTDAGGIFCICTGRMTSSIVKFYKQYGFTGYTVSFNGAEICNTDTGEKVYKEHVDNATCIKLLRYAEENKKRVQVYPNDILTVSSLNDDYRAYAKRCHVEICDVEGAVGDLFVEKGYTSGKVLFYTDDSTRQKMLKDIKDIVGENYEVICSNPEHIDIMAKGVSKGNAVLKLCEMLGKSTDKLICFGDESNDASMIEVAGLGAVTANGSEYLKSIADIVIPSCEDGGVGFALDKFGIK